VKAVSEQVLVRKLEENLWQWRLADSQGQWTTSSYYTGDANLLKESTENKQVSLILPGQSIVSQVVPADIADRKQLLKVLPFELEENIIDPVEDLQFHFGEIIDERIAVSFGDLEWMQGSIVEVESTSCEVETCVVDYLQLPRAEKGWTFLIENNLLMAVLDEGEGFCVELDMAPLYIQGLLARDSKPDTIELYADSEDALFRLNQLLPKELIDNEDIEILEGERDSTLWDLLDLEEPLVGDFRTGKLARKVQFEKWWDNFKIPIYVCAAGFVLALATAWLMEAKLTDQRKTILVQTDEIFQQVMPGSKVRNPLSKLKTILGSDNNDSAEPSSAVHLIASVAPSVKAIGSIKIKSMRYTINKGQLQLNIEGASYQDFENLQKKISESGFQVEIRNQSANGNVFQAQFRISEAS